MAKPVAGTTATHVACLFAVGGTVQRSWAVGAAATGRLREPLPRLWRDSATRAADYLLGLRRNDVRIESGNKSCAENVGRGALAVAWTDTDDAMIELAAGRPVRIVYPDSGPGAVGTLFIPNPLAAIAGSPHPAEADRLIDYLLSPEVEVSLARGPSAQIPLNRQSAGSFPLPGSPSTGNGLRVRANGFTPFANAEPVRVDFNGAAMHWPEAQKFVNEEFFR